MVDKNRNKNSERMARELYDLESHMAHGGDYWEFMRARHPEKYLTDGTIEPEYKKLLSIRKQI